MSDSFISKYKLDSSDIFGWLTPRDERRIVVIESFWCIGAHLVISFSIQYKTNIEITTEIAILSFANTQHDEIDRLLEIISKSEVT